MKQLFSKTVIMTALMATMTCHAAADMIAPKQNKAAAGTTSTPGEAKLAPTGKTPVSQAPELNAPAAADVSRATAPVIKTRANSFNVTVVTKDQTHPYYGSGDKSGFAVDGVQGKELVLVRGTTYVLEVRSTPMHDVYISGSETGWGGDVIEQGVQGNFTYEGALTFTPDLTTPDLVYYQCQNHKSMGGRIFIVNPGDPVDLAGLHKKFGIVEVVTETGLDNVSDQDVKQKLSYASIVVMSKPARRVRDSNNSEAMALLAEATELLAKAKADNAAGQHAQAMSSVDDALRKMSAASQMVPSEDVQGEQKKRYMDLLKSLAEIRKTHKEKYEWIVKHQGAAKGVKYDTAFVDERAREAAALAESGRYDQAVGKLLDAEKIVTLSVNKMLDAQTMVYKLNLDTPEGEFEHEKERYLGYEELVPVAIEQRQPNEGQRALFDGFIAKADGMYQQALKLGERKEYPDAIKLMQEATNQILRGLRLLGVNQ